MAAPFEILPATAARWPDFEALMGPRGAYGGCWCMSWRLSRKEHDAGAGEGNRAAIRAVFAADEVPGVLGYDRDKPVGWCAVAPRQRYPRLASSRVLQPVDDQPVWSVSCFLIRKSHRRRGLSVALLRGACDLARTRGGRLVEGYPIDPTKRPYPDAYAWTGLVGAFRAAGFEEVARRSPTRPIMRRALAEV